MLLTPDQLEQLRKSPIRVCRLCRRVLYRNYCRDHEEFFEDRHTDDCQSRSEHSDHRNYRDFSGTTESSLEELEVQYRKEGSLPKEAPS